VNDTASYLLSLAVGIAILLLHRFVLSNRAQVWLGALLPAALLATIVHFGAQGRIDGLREWVLLGVGLAVLCGVRGSGQDARKERLQREDERIDAIHAQGVEGHSS
jgi:steroid 5-alpha reductase family enzyme